MWTWDASAPAAAASGVCDDEERAKNAASVWMLANGANSDTVKQVLLAVGAGNLLTRHEPTGVMLQARRGRDGQVRWAYGRGTA
jgi:hypothetical protein